MLSVSQSDFDELRWDGLFSLKRISCFKEYTSPAAFEVRTVKLLLSMTQIDSLIICY